MMAMTLVNAKFSISGLDEMRKAMDDAGLSISQAFGLPRGMSEKTSPHQTVVSRREYESLAVQFAQQSQRLKILLVLLSDEELHRLGLLEASNGVADDRDYLKLIGALDARVEQFNAAHGRLTGKRKRISETGSLGNLSGEEMGIVLKSRAAGDSIQDTLQKIEALRKENSK